MDTNKEKNMTAAELIKVLQGFNPLALNYGLN